MWKRPALASFFLGALLTAGPAAAASGSGVLYESAAGAPFREDWDTVLFQGVSADAGTAFEASRRDPAGHWSPWVAATVERRANGRFWGRAKLPLGPGPVRVRSTGVSGYSEIFEAEVFVEGPEAPEPGFTTESAFELGGGTRPLVHSRAEWKARGLAPGASYVPHVPVRITLHHTSGPQTKTLGESEEEVRFIQDFHQRGRGWIDIGYHFLIDAQGNIFEGRPEGVVGAHVKDHNTGNIGIALLGNYHPPKNDQVTPEQLAAIVKAGRYLVAQYGIEPSSLKGHRDYRDTDCPGDIAYGLLDELRKDFAEPEPAPAPPDALAGKRGLGDSLPSLVRRADWDGRF